MIARGFMEPVAKDDDPWWTSLPIIQIENKLKPISDFIIDDSVNCSKAIQILKDKSIDLLLQFQDGLVNFVN